MTEGKSKNYKTYSERKIGRKEMAYLYEHRKDIFPDDIWGKLLKMVIERKGLFGIFTIKEGELL